MLFITWTGLHKIIQITANVCDIISLRGASVPTAIKVFIYIIKDKRDVTFSLIFPAFVIPVGEKGDAWSLWNIDNLS